jgi:hypothetical protein
LSSTPCSMATAARWASATRLPAVPSGRSHRWTRLRCRSQGEQSPRWGEPPNPSPPRMPGPPTGDARRGGSGMGAALVAGGRRGSALRSHQSAHTIDPTVCAIIVPSRCHDRGPRDRASVEPALWRLTKVGVS